MVPIEVGIASKSQDNVQMAEPQPLEASPVLMCVLDLAKVLACHHSLLHFPRPSRV